MLRILIVAIALLSGAVPALSQGYTRYTYHDQARKNLKEAYQVKDTVANVPHGKYISYFLHGKMESQGQFTNGETSGVWEFYYETGTLRMRGILFKGENYGLWEYFYEGGQKSMEGIIYGKNRHGEWKMYYENGRVREAGEYDNNKRTGVWRSYFEDGTLKGTIDYTDDFGKYVEYYHSGKILAEGPRSGTRNVGHWRYYGEDGALQSEGDYSNGRKHGQWVTYFPSGKVASRGQYENDEPTGVWVYLYEDGKISSTGSYLNGRKEGYWKTLDDKGGTRSEATFDKGTGDYKEFHSNGAVKQQGRIVDGKRQGRWEFFTSDRKLEGYCVYEKDKGTYYGYYPNGTLYTKGTLEGELKTGTWEIYNEEGTLSGYYKPFYENSAAQADIVRIAGEKRPPASRGQRWWFDTRNSEFRGVIAATNPVWTAAGRLPVAIEFYLEDRLGHEFEFIGIRDPFFRQDRTIPPGKLFERGYSIAIKQKLYNPLRAGAWYFGHELRFTNRGHFVNQQSPRNPDNIFTFTGVEQRIQWGPLLGYRIMRHNNADGFTIDCFVSCNFGYRSFDVDDNYAYLFYSVNRLPLATTFNVGLNLGQVFSFE